MSDPIRRGTKLLMEFIGTFILSGAINLSTVYSNDGSQHGTPILLFLAFFSAITITRSISGGHLNPAVTTAFFFKEGDEKDHTITTLYFLAQFLGAIASCLFSFIFYNDNIFKLTVSAGITPLAGFLTEVIATCVFTYTILCQSDAEANLTKDQSISTMIITIALFGSCGIAGNLTGGCLNPAIGFAHNFIRLLVTGDASECKYLWLYILGPLFGGFLAAMLYNNLFRRYFKETALAINSNL